MLSGQRRKIFGGMACHRFALADFSHCEQHAAWHRACPARKKINQSDEGSS
jgi:hypothetical protein